MTEEHPYRPLTVEAISRGDVIDWALEYLPRLDPAEGAVWLVTRDRRMFRMDKDADGCWRYDADEAVELVGAVCMAQTIDGQVGINGRMYRARGPISLEPCFNTPSCMPGNTIIVRVS